MEHCEEASVSRALTEWALTDWTLSGLLLSGPWGVGSLGRVH